MNNANIIVPYTRPLPIRVGGIRLIACKMRGQQSNPWFYFAPLARNISTKGLIKQKRSDPYYSLEAALSQTYYYSWNDLSTVVAELCEWNCMQFFCKYKKANQIRLPLEKIEKTLPAKAPM